MLHVRCGYEAASSFLDQSDYALCVPLHVNLLTRYLEGRTKPPFANEFSEVEVCMWHYPSGHGVQRPGCTSE